MIDYKKETRTRISLPFDNNMNTIFSAVDVWLAEQIPPAFIEVPDEEECRVTIK